MIPRCLRSSAFLALSLLAAGGPVDDAAAAEQVSEPEHTRHHRSLCWRGHPLTECGAFVITELGAYARIDDDPTHASEGPLYFTLDVGPMWNRTPRNAVGLTAYLATGDAHARLGARVRYRRWISRTISVDVAPGVILYGSEDGGYTYQAPGFVGALSLSVGDLVGVALEMEHSGYRPYSLAIPLVGSDTTWRVGGKLGSGLGVLGTAALVGFVVYVVAAAGG